MNSDTDPMNSQRLVFTSHDSIPIRHLAVMRSVAVSRERGIRPVCNSKRCCPLLCYSDRTLTSTKTVSCPPHANIRSHLRYYFRSIATPASPSGITTNAADAVMQWEYSVRSSTEIPAVRVYTRTQCPSLCINWAHNGVTEHGRRRI